MKLFKKLLLAFLILFLLQSCDDDNDPQVLPTQTIVDLASANPNLSILAQALQRADLLTALSNANTAANSDGKFTVLAPTNTAFTQFLEDNNFDALEDVPTSLLTQVLLNHVINGDLKSTDLSTGYANTLATSSASGTPMSIYIDTNQGIKFNGISNVTNIFNVEADNGTIHVVDTVIGLPTVVTFALADTTNFSILVQALTRSDLTTDFVSILSTPVSAPAPFTVFAPNNQAFIDVLDELDLAELNDIPVATLDSTLKYHVIAEMNAQASALSDDLTLPTLGGDITANITGGATLTDSNNRVSEISATDIQANNGVIHMISRVILP